MYSEFVINIDIIKVIGLIFTVSGSAIIGAWYTNGKFSRIEEQLKYLEKTVEEVKGDYKQLIKPK